MKNKNLKDQAIKGFAHNTVLSNCEILEKELAEAKSKFKLAKKDMKAAKGKLNQAMEEMIPNIEQKENQATHQFG